MCACVRQFSIFNFQFDWYHRIHPLVVKLAAYGTEAAEFLAEILGTDALHQVGIAAGEVLMA